MYEFKFYVVTLRFADANAIKIKEFEPLFAQIGDWIRPNGLTWIVWTSKSSTEIYNLLAGHITREDSMLVAGLDPTSKQGWMPKWVWDWFDAKQGPALGLGAAVPPNTGMLGALSGLINQKPKG